MNTEDKLQLVYEIVSSMTQREQLLLSLTTFMVDCDLKDIGIYDKIKPLLIDDKWTHETIAMIDATTRVLWNDK